MKEISIAVFLVFSGINSVEAKNSEFKINGNKFNQGEVVIIQSVSKSTAPFSVQFLKRQYKSFDFDKKQTVFIGIHYQLRPGTYMVIAQYGNEVLKFTPFVIRVREIFPKLKYFPPKRPEAKQQRINKETEQKRVALERISFRADVVDRFQWPVRPAIVSASFGEKRCRDRIGLKHFNCRYHLGTDFRAAFDFFHRHPVSVRAINDGKVVMTKIHEIDGKIVVIDHGNGISAEYMHLSEFLAKEGQSVKRGQEIGIAGRTGATEAIHLHLTIKMDNGKTIVDPHKFLNHTAF